MPEVELAGIGLGMSDELRHRLGRERRVHHQDRVAVGDAGDRGEILRRIVAGILRYRRDHRQGRGIAVEQGVAVGLGGRQSPGAERAAGGAPASGRLSLTRFWPTAAWILCASSRASTSVWPPAGAGTIILISLSG